MNPRPDRRITLVFLAILLLGLFFFLWAMRTGNTPFSPTPPSPTPAPDNLGEPLPAPTPDLLPLGPAQLRVGESARFKGLTLELVRVISDSRCPAGVTCIWAGTVTAEIRIISGTETSTSSIDLGDSITTETEIVTFTSVSPKNTEGKNIPPSDYMLTFTVLSRTLENNSPPLPAPLPPMSPSGCYVGGCSSEVCSDTRDMASNCIYREEFACYKRATCERQSSGVCGWTETPELRACLTTASKTQ